MKSDFFLVTCEHGGNRVPSRYRPLLAGQETLLHSHRGYDAGALRMAREMAAALDAPLCAATVSRLLIDLNRSITHPRLYSTATRAAPAEVREDLLRRYYLPYRSAVERMVAQAIDSGQRVVHLSCHSFTPQLGDTLRNADIGLLYDPARPGELDFCRRWRRALQDTSPAARIRMNYPYAGSSDGFTTSLRKRHAAALYLGMELEINQIHVAGGATHWRGFRRAILDALARTVSLHDASLQRFEAASF